MTELRPYQKQALRRVTELWKSGRKVLAVAPTGSGKGTMAADLMRRAAHAGKRSIFIVHLRDIAEDMQERLAGLGVTAGMILPGHARDDSALVQIASVQSLVGSSLQAYDFALVDEAHHYRAEQWGAVLSEIGRAKLLGLTATPQRGDGKGLGKIFDDLVEVVSHKTLIEEGLIVRPRLLVPSCKLYGNMAMEPAHAYLKYCRDRSAFIFLRNLKKAKTVRAELAAEGIASDIVTDSTPHKARRESVARLRDGSISAIINYGTMVEGVDVPRASAVILEQPCVHAGTYIQRVGRALRAFPSKDDALIVDLCGAAYKHGMPASDQFEFTLGDRPISLTGGLIEIKSLTPKRREGVVAGVDMVEVGAEWLSRNGGPRVVDFGKVDWDLSNVAISKTLKVGVDTVSAWRSKLGKAPSPYASKGVHASIRVDIEKVDWDLPDKELSIQTGLSVSCIGGWRSRLGKPRSKDALIRLSADDFKNVDWAGETDAAISRRLGIGKSSVGIWRKKLT